MTKFVKPVNVFSLENTAFIIIINTRSVRN